MYRTKLKKKRDATAYPNKIRPATNFIETKGLGRKVDFIHQESFDTEDKEYEMHEHGLSIKSYKVGGSSGYLNNSNENLNKGKKYKKKRRRGIPHRNGGYSSREVRRLMEEW